MDSSTLLLLIGLVVVFTGVNCQQPYKVCSLLKDTNDCSQLERNDKLQCQNNAHGIDCILNIQHGLTDFGRVTAEEALIGARHVDNVVVLGEFRSDAVEEDSEYATVVLVRSDHTNGLKGLKGKKYCHPGFKFDEVVTELVLKEFENAVLKQNNAEGCSNTVDSGTLLEKELKALVDFFGPSCRPGPWVGLGDYDNKYYKQYPKLCELCISDNKCTVPQGVAPFQQSLDCLVNGGGEVSLTTVNTVNDFFNRTENIHKKDDYRYLCRNGDLSQLNQVCTWSKQPLNLIIANRNNAASLKTELEGWLSKYVISSAGPSAFSQTSPVVEESLKAILFPADKDYQRINFLQPALPLKDYIEKYRVIPNTRESEKCNQNIRWCTISDAEQQKCTWLAQASLNRAIQPVLNCVQSQNNLTCLEDIKNDKADVVTSDAHYGYIARKKNLAPLAYPETDRKNRIKPIIVIKDKSDVRIERFENLKMKKACLPEYGAIEWLSFINTARDHGVLAKSTCDYGELISEFVGDSCMPGAHDKEHETSAKVNQEKLCSLCVPDPYESKTAKTCNTDNTNKYYGDVGALKCLREAGDFAVITKGDYPQFESSEFRVLCKNGSLAAYTGLQVDDNCVLTEIVDSEVVSKRTSSKNADIGNVLLNFEKHFGPARKAFEVFNIFNGTLDLLFRDSTPGLAPTQSDNPQIRNYLSLFSHVDQCTGNKGDDGDGASALQNTILPFILTAILLFITKY